MAPFSEPDHMREIFGSDMLEDESQFEGFALLTATGGIKPFECVGEEEESKAAIGMLAADPRWRDHRIVRRLSAQVLNGSAEEKTLVAKALELSDEHSVPPELMASVRAVLGS
jgi:hypothetical protein